MATFHNQLIISILRAWKSTLLAVESRGRQSITSSSQNHNSIDYNTVRARNERAHEGSLPAYDDFSLSSLRQERLGRANQSYRPRPSCRSHQRMSYTEPSGYRGSHRLQPGNPGFDSPGRTIAPWRLDERWQELSMFWRVFSLFLQNSLVLIVLRTKA